MKASHSTPIIPMVMEKSWNFIVLKVQEPCIWKICYPFVSLLDTTNTQKPKDSFSFVEKRCFSSFTPQSRKKLVANIPQIFNFVLTQETVFKNFQEIQFMPDQFKNYLLSTEVGFSSCETIGVPLNQSKGKSLGQKTYT